LNSGRVELLDNARLVSQLCSLERKTSRIGKDSVDHPPGQHDDVINAASGALVLASRCASQEVPLGVPLFVWPHGDFVNGPTATPQKVDATREFYHWSGSGGGGWPPGFGR